MVFLVSYFFTLVGSHPLIGRCLGAEVGLLHHQEGEDVPDQTLVQIKTY